MKNYLKSNRSFKNIHSGLVYNLYINADNNNDTYLFNESFNSKLTQFYCSAINGIDYKFKDGSIINLNAGEFFTPYNTVGNPITKKYSTEKRFKKII